MAGILGVVSALIAGYLAFREEKKRTGDKMKGLYRFVGDCGRHGCLYGMFIAEEDDVKNLLESKMELYFGEVLGKHSDICYIVDEGDISLISDDPDFVGLCEQYNAQVGFDPVYMLKRQADRNKEEEDND